MYQTSSVIVYLAFLAVIFVIVLIILGVAFARTRRRQRIEQEKGPGTVVGEGGAPLTNERSPHYQESVQPHDADVGSNVRSLPTAQDVERVKQNEHDEHHDNDAAASEGSIRQTTGRKSGTNSTNHH